MQSSRVSGAEVGRFLVQVQRQGITSPTGEPLRQHKVQHILLKADFDNTVFATEGGTRKIYAQTCNGADFFALAHQYSQGASVGSGGGSGWLSGGQTVTPFKDAVHKLKPGQVSPPVRTQFGWYIIKLDGMRDAGTPEERQRNAVRQCIPNQKAQRATTNLL